MSQQPEPGLVAGLPEVLRDRKHSDSFFDAQRNKPLQLVGWMVGWLDSSSTFLHIGWLVGWLDAKIEQHMCTGLRKFEWFTTPWHSFQEQTSTRFQECNCYRLFRTK